MTIKFGPTSIWTWQPPRDGETVPDYPPVDLTPFISSAGFELTDWQRSVLRLVAIPIAPPLVAQEYRWRRSRRLSAMHSAYRRRNR